MSGVESGVDIFHGPALLVSSTAVMTCQQPAHEDTTRNARDIGSTYRQSVSIADLPLLRGGRRRPLWPRRGWLSMAYNGSDS